MPAEGVPIAWIGFALVVGLIPFALIAVTCYAKITIVMAFLRKALGLQQIPSNIVITAISILLSAFIMAPVGADTLTAAAPLMTSEALRAETLAPSALAAEIEPVLEPLRGWLVRHGGEAEREMFQSLGTELYPPEHHDLLGGESLLVIVPGFMLTELKESFVIGFLLFIPFIVIDFVVGNILVSMGLPMMTPSSVSLPFKLLLFVMIDGWTLLVQGLVLGYA